MATNIYPWAEATEFLDGGCTARDVAKIARLCWPDFRPVNDAILFPWVAEDPVWRSRVDAMFERGASPYEVEANFTAFEVTCLFPDAIGAAGVTAEEDLAATMTLAWRARLSEQFPERHVTVEVFREEADDSLYVAVRSTPSS